MTLDKFHFVFVQFHFVSVQYNFVFVQYHFILAQYQVVFAQYKIGFGGLALQPLDHIVNSIDIKENYLSKMQKWAEWKTQQVENCHDPGS